MNTLSIITTCFNSEKTIIQTIQSIKELKESFSDFEYIVIDANSSDTTKNIIATNRDYIDQYICEDDSGIYDGMNKGAHIAQGKYLLYINSDDMVIPTNLISAMNVISKTDFDFIGCDVEIIDQLGSLQGERKSKLEPLDSAHRGMPCSHQGFIIKRDFFNYLGGFNLKIKVAADYDLILKALTKSNNFINISTCIAKYRLGGVSYGNVAMDENFEIQNRYVGKFCAYRNLLREKVSLTLQKVLPLSLVRKIKRVKGSSYQYIQKK